MKKQEIIEIKPNEELNELFVTMLFDNKYTAKNIKELLAPLSKETFYQMLTGTGFLLYTGPVTTEEKDAGSVTLDLAKAGQPLRIGIYNINISQEVMIPLVLNEQNTLTINLNIKDNIVRQAVFTPINGPVNGPTHSVKLVEVTHSYAPIAKINEALKLCTKFGIKEIPIHPDDLLYIEEHAAYDIGASMRPHDYKQQINLAKIQKTGLPIKILEQSINSAEEFIQLFMQAEATEFKSFVKKHSPDLANYVKARSASYLEGISDILPNNKWPVSLFEHLGIIGYQVTPGKGSLQPYTTNNYIGHNIKNIPDLSKKLSFIFKELRGREVEFTPEQMQYMKIWLNPDDVIKSFNPKGKFTDTIKKFIDSGFKLFAPELNDGKNNEKENYVVKYLVPKLKAIQEFIAVLTLSKTKESEKFQKYITDELTKVAQDLKALPENPTQLLKMLGVELGNRKASDITEISEEACANFKKLDKLFEDAGKTLPMVLRGAALSEGLGTKLKYKTSEYDPKQLLNFFEYMSKQGEFKAVKAQLNKIVANKEFPLDQKLLTSMQEYGWLEAPKIELGGDHLIKVVDEL